MAAVAPTVKSRQHAGRGPRSWTGVQAAAPAVPPACAAGSPGAAVAALSQSREGGGGAVGGLLLLLLPWVMGYGLWVVLTKGRAEPLS